MATVIIEDDSLPAKQLAEFIITLPFAIVLGEEKKSFSEAAKECNVVTVDEFIVELKSQVKLYINHA